ncbi:hypothetical protein DVH05_023118 [Phytophthora capsici]|nr:hypothetical protein DVH05_023118 [Phytophthora capsici]
MTNKAWTGLELTQHCCGSSSNILSIDLATHVARHEAAHARIAGSALILRPLLLREKFSREALDSRPNWNFQQSLSTVLHQNLLPCRAGTSGSAKRSFDQ